LVLAQAHCSHERNFARSDQVSVAPAGTGESRYVDLNEDRSKIDESQRHTSSETSLGDESER
jgi:hypothetical protein